MSVHITSQSVTWMSDVSSCPLVSLLKCKTCSAIFYEIFISSFMLTQYIDFSARSFVFSIPMWFMWSSSSACVFNISGTITCLPFIMIPSITTMSYLNDQYVLMSHWTWSLISDHPAMIYYYLRQFHYLILNCLDWLGDWCHVCSTLFALQYTTDHLWVLWSSQLIWNCTKIWLI